MVDIFIFFHKAGFQIDVSIMNSDYSVYLKILSRKCSKIPSIGKITIENKSNEIIRVGIIPAISWNYHEQRTNKTLLRNPEKTIGGNHIL